MINSRALSLSHLEEENTNRNHYYSLQSATKKVRPHTGIVFLYPLYMSRCRVFHRSSSIITPYHVQVKLCWTAHGTTTVHHVSLSFIPLGYYRELGFGSTNPVARRLSSDFVNSLSRAPKTKKKNQAYTYAEIRTPDISSTGTLVSISSEAKQASKETPSTGAANCLYTRPYWDRLLTSTKNEQNNNENQSAVHR